MSPKRPRRRALALCIGAALSLSLALSMAGASGASGGPAKTPQSNAASKTLADPTSDGWSGPPHLSRITDNEQAQGARFDPVDQTVRKQKLTIRLSKISTMQYLQLCYFFPTLGPGLVNSPTIRSGSPTFLYTPPEGRPKTWPPACAPNRSLFDKATKIPLSAWFDTSSPFTMGWAMISASAWVQSPAGAGRAFGVFPPVRVHTVAFGSIPVTATLHISQPEAGGLTTPFTLLWSGSLGQLKPGTVLPSFDSGPNTTGTAAFFQTPAQFSGPVTIRLSDVSVDGVPLTVGPGCAAGARVVMDPKTGWYGHTAQAPGQPGEFAPLNSTGSYLPGTVDIGKFSGCGRRHDNLDPLLTGMISGPGNHIEMDQDRALGTWCLDGSGQNDPSDPTYVGGAYCDLNDAPPQNAAQAHALIQSVAGSSSKASAGSTEADLSKLSPHDRKEAQMILRKLAKDPLYPFHHRGR